MVKGDIIYWLCHIIDYCYLHSDAQVWEGWFWGWGADRVSSTTIVCSVRI